MAKSKFWLGTLVLVLGMTVLGCEEEPEPTKDNVVGTWKMSVGGRIYGLTFTNYGVLTYTDGVHMASNFDYTYNGTTLELSWSGKKYSGKAIIEGNKLTLSNFVEPNSLDAEGVLAPIPNGIYTRQ